MPTPLNQTTLSDAFWDLPRSRRLLRQCLLHPFYKRLVDGTGSMYHFRTFVQQQMLLLPAWRLIADTLQKNEEAIPQVADHLTEEAGLQNTFAESFGFSPEAPDPLPSTLAYMEFLQDVADFRRGDHTILESTVRALAALSSRFRLLHWISHALLDAIPEVATSDSPSAKWLSFCDTDDFRNLAARLGAALDVAASRGALHRQAELGSLTYIQTLGHEFDFLTEICGGTTQSLEDTAHLRTLMSVARITPPRVLIVAGSDSGGGAGLQADLKSCTALGSFGTTAVTALTAQNSFGVQGIFPIPIDFLRAQMESVLTDFGTDVVKTGMLATSEIVTAVALALKEHVAPAERWRRILVVDPVMVSTSGHALLQPDAVESVKKELFPLATIITPNLPEARLLLGRDGIDTVEAMQQAARELAAMGPDWVLVKGGHLAESEDELEATDVLCDGATGECTAYKSSMLKTSHTHGTGCTLASSIASCLARGMEMPMAVQEAKRYVSGAIAASTHLALGHGPQGPMNHSWRLFEW